MFDEAQLYAPVTSAPTARSRSSSAPTTPGVRPRYRARRNAIAALAIAWQPGEPCRTRPTPTRSTRSGGRQPRARGSTRRLPASTWTASSRSAARPTTCRSSTR